MANDSGGQRSKRHRASASSPSLRANNTSVDARKNGSFSTRRASVSSGSVMLASRSFLTFLQTILHALDLSSLLVLRQVCVAEDDGEDRMTPLPLLHLLPNALLHV